MDSNIDDTFEDIFNYLNRYKESLEQAKHDKNDSTENVLSKQEIQMKVDRVNDYLVGNPESIKGVKQLLADVIIYQNDPELKVKKTTRK